MNQSFAPYEFRLNLFFVFGIVEIFTKMHEISSSLKTLNHQLKVIEFDNDFDTDRLLL